MATAESSSSLGPTWPPQELVDNARELDDTALMEQIVHSMFAHGRNAVATMAAVIEWGSQEKEAAEVDPGPAATKARGAAAIYVLAERLAANFNHRLTPVVEAEQHGQ